MKSSPTVNANNRVPPNHAFSHCQPLDDTSMSNLCRLYLAYLERSSRHLPPLPSKFKIGCLRSRVNERVAVKMARPNPSYMDSPSKERN
jgi:hypothetical protein